MILKRIAVVGAGPAGLTAAIALAQLKSQNYAVTVVEQSPHIAHDPTKSYSVTLAPNGIQAWNIVGLPEVKAAAQPLVGLEIRPTPEFCIDSKYNPDNAPFLYAIPRAKVVDVLLEKAENLHIPIHYGVKFDAESPQTGYGLPIDADIIIVADGSNSVGRHLIGKHYGDSPETVAASKFAWGYFVINSATIPDTLDMFHFQLWPKPEWGVTIAGMPIKTGGMNMAVFGAESNLRPFQDLTKRTELVQSIGFHPDQFPAFERDLTIGGIYTGKFDHWYTTDDQGRSLLGLGDAVHPVSPFVGLGINNAAMDVACMIQLLSTGQSFSEMMPQFQAIRRSRQQKSVIWSK